jgi:adenylate cyclase
LITDLSKISGLFVISRNSVFSYKNVVTRPEQVSQELGVRYLVEGSVRKAGNRVRISAQLVDAQSQYQLWAERYDRELIDIFELLDDVIKQIVAALAVKLTVGEQSRVGAPPTESLQAYDAFVRGREEYIRRERSANLQARELFQQAIGLDPKYAEAYAFLGRTYLVEMVNQWSDDPDILEKIFVFGEKAVELDESQPTAHETLAYGHVARRDHDQAIAAARKAIQYAPNFAEGYITLAEVLCFSGEPAEAVQLVEQAMRLNPRYTPNYLWALGQAHRLLGNYEDAIRNFQRVVTRNPDHLVTHLMLAASFVETEQFDAAKIEAQEVLRISPDFSVDVSHRRSPYKLQAETDRQTASLRRAGLG